MAKCKYYKLVRQVSYDSGQTWSNVTPLEVMQGDLYQSGATDCGSSGDTGYTETYRWVDSSTTQCYDDGLYYIAYKQVSYDGGINWQTVYPMEFSVGSMVEEVDCSCVTHLQTNNKFYGINVYKGDGSTYDGRTISTPCQTESYDSGETWVPISGQTLTRKDVRGGEGAGNLLLRKGVVGDCVGIIDKDAFSYATYCIDIVLPNSIREIGKWAFQYCERLKCFTIPDGVESIGHKAFEYCTSLEEITVPNSVTLMEDSVFRECYNLKNVTLSNSLDEIDSEMFTNCSSLSSFTIPESVTTIGDWVFSGCTSLTSFTIPDNVTSIGGVMFGGCTGLRGNITIPNSVTRLGNGTFCYCSGITSVTYESGSPIREIGWNTFSGCTSLADVNIPTGVTAIRDNAFKGCSSLTELEFPSSLTSLGSWVLEGVHLNSLTVLAPTPPTTLELTFQGFTVDAIYVPSESVAEYKQAEGWRDYANKIQAIS